MTVLEIMELIKDKDAAVLVYDNETSKLLDVDLDDLHHATVKALSSDGKEFKVFIEAPTQKYYTYLDVTYSARIELDVPIGADKKELLKRQAEKLLDAMPDGFCVNGHDFNFDYDNIQSGGFEDMIEQC